MFLTSHDTIVAIATPAGVGGIGVVRLSGNDIKKFMLAILGEEIQPRLACYKQFLGAEGECLDTGIALYFSGPNSFTGQAILELQGHGGSVVQDLLLQRCIELGARMARPGEFSERAFLNDKLDLAQAEAVADLIEAASVQAAKSAVRSMCGDFSKEIKNLVNSLKDVRVFVEASIDFPEEEIELLADQVLLKTLDDIAVRLGDIINKARHGVLLRDGLTIVLAGRPNAGKSSLLNCLVGTDEAIVTTEAGTTRDVLRKTAVINGIPLQLIDTAGLRETTSIVEKEGIRRAWSEIEAADHVLFVADASDVSIPNIKNVWPEFFKKFPESSASLTLVLNKIDLTDLTPGEMINTEPTFCISAKHRTGINNLVNYLLKQAGQLDLGHGAFSARGRHVAALKSAWSHVSAGKQQLIECGFGELIAEDLRQAQNSLSEITGNITSDELLGEIFSSFCIGK